MTCAKFIGKHRSAAERRSAGCGAAPISHLPHAAALAVAILVEGEHAFLTNQLHGLRCIRERVLNANAVVLLHGVEQLVGFSVQPPGVEAAQ